MIPISDPFRAKAQASVRRASLGLTLIELAVTMAVAAVLLATATPSFVSMLQRNRVLAELSSLGSDLQYARSEAMKQGLPVSICPSSNGTSCLTTNTWHRGWIVFPDPTASGSIGTGVSPLRTRSGFVGGDTLAASPSVVSLTFSRDGFAVNLPAGGTLLTLRTSPVNAKATSCLSLNLVGRQTVLAGGTGSCS